MDTQATNENPLSSQRQSSNAFKLRVGQFNVLNLVKENTVFYEHEKYKKETVDKKVAWITEQLKRMNATIVGFEEVFHVEVLKRATDACDLFQGGEVVCYGDGTGPSVALASRYPILDKENIVHFPKEAILHFDGTELPITKFSRPVLRCVIGLPTGHSVTVFVIHLKSKRPLVEDSLRHDQKAKAIGHAKALIIRAAEATAVRCILVNEMRNNNRPVIVLGDLNDTVHSVTTEIITGTPPWKKLSHEQKQQIWDVLLWSTNEVQVRSSDRDVTYSYVFSGHSHLFIHLIPSLL
jgi:predicted extracellular nuclease